MYTTKKNEGCPFTLTIAVLLFLFIAVLCTGVFEKNNSKVYSYEESVMWIQRIAERMETGTIINTIKEKVDKEREKDRKEELGF